MWEPLLRMIKIVINIVTENIHTMNQNYNKIVECDWLSSAQC